MNISNFSRHSTLKTNYLLKSKTRINIEENIASEVNSQRFSYLAKPNVKRIKSIFDRQRMKSKFDMRRAETFLKLLHKPSQTSCELEKCTITVEYSRKKSKNCDVNKCRLNSNHVRQTKCDSNQIKASKKLSRKFFDGN